MTKPSDFTPERVLEVDQPAQTNTRALERQIWFTRALGVVLFVVGIAVIGASAGFGTSTFALGSVVLVAFAGYIVITESRARRISVSLEKRLRLGLLVHNMELENMAMQDDLTQLFNRRYFFDRLDRELETAKAFKRPLSVMVIDLNGMKQVNDTYGHRVGDEMLEGFGRFLLDSTRASDVPARIGGDEFAIILPDTSDKAAHNLKIRLAKRLESIDVIDRNALSLKVSAAFGVAGYPSAGETVDEIITQSDADMYADKNERRGETARSGAAKGVSTLRLEKGESAG